MDVDKQIRLEMLENQQNRIQAQLNRAKTIEKRFPWYRFISFFTGIIFTVVAAQIGTTMLAWGVGILSILAFGLIVREHRRVENSIKNFSILLRINQQQTARCTLNWELIPKSNLRSEISHPFEKDLNLYGEKSLHQLMNTAASKGGSHRLFEWLMNTHPEELRILSRQKCIHELLDHFPFRSRINFLGNLASDTGESAWDGERLLEWLNQDTETKSLRNHLLLLSCLALINFVLFFLYWAGTLPALWIFSLIIYLGAQSMRYRQTQELFNEAYQLASMLGSFMPILREIEKYPARPGSPLSNLFLPLQQPDNRPGESLKRLSWIVSAASLQNNPFAALFLNIIVPWNAYFLYRLKRYKHELRFSLPTWLEIWHELEALISLTNFAFLNPQNTFPQLISNYQSKPFFIAVAMAHPLIPNNKRVSNNFTISEAGTLAIITGSNMSGKSTFLRTIGINLQLAFAGSTVTAKEFKTVPFHLFTCINLSDSLLDGISYFYAEVKRLKALLDNLESNEEMPLFYFIDEIFRGTNNRERQIGSRAFTRSLLGKNGTGLISTHDLELVNLEKESEKISNYHFREDIVEGKMVFDYKLRPGPCPTTNALKIMSIEGLPIEEEDR